MQQSAQGVLQNFEAAHRVFEAGLSLGGACMEDWDNIVVLKFKGPKPECIVVRCVEDAARLLLGRWPFKQGTSYRRAMLNCSAALKGRGSSEAARWSFMVAAMEAAIPFEVKDRFESEIAAVCDEFFEEDRVAFELAGQLPGADVAVATQPFWWPQPPASGPSAR